MAICIPILIDAALDFVSHMEPSKYQSYIPRRELFLAVILPDLFIICYVLPYHEFDWMPGLISFRDTLFNYAFLSYMNRLYPKIWSKKLILFVGALIMISNVIISYPEVFTEAQLIIQVLIGIAFGVMIFLLIRWFRYSRTVKDKSEQNPVLLCNLYCIAYSIFFFGVWINNFIPSMIADPDWANNGCGYKYLILYTCLLAVCTLLVTCVSSRIAKLESIEAKVIFEYCKL